MEFLNILIGVFFLIVAFFMLYMLQHMESEKIKGEYIPLMWEEGGWLRKVKRKIFDKSDVVYRDGDNT